GSNLEVRCYLRYKGSELSTVSNQLQLCLPNGSCIAGHELNVGSAQPQHSGSYTCRFGAVNNSTIVKVLSASSAQLVAENSDFTVNCSVHCGMEKNCTDAADLQLCLPNNTCLPEARLTGSARPGSSVGISFETSRTRTQEFSCTEIQMPTGLTGFMQYVAASLIGAFVTALVASAAVGLAIR
uniref:IG domain-containing protein n=1 Tax=Macrostomum lignano TaxID=282301 RepID=A0A1I8HDY1_9PLAT